MAGVSVATVSRVINGVDTVDASLRALVLDAARRLEYQPDYIARSMRTGRTQTLGLVARNIANPNSAIMCAAVESAAVERNYSVLLCNSQEDPVMERRYIDLLLRRKVDGLVVFVADEANSAVELALKRNVPVVLADSELEGAELESVTIAGSQGVESAIAHLRSLGHTRIVALLPGQHTLPGKARLRGFLESMQDIGPIHAGSDLIRICRNDASDVFPQLQEVMSLKPRVTAVVATTLRLHMKALEWFKQQGVRLGQDLSFVGFDDPEISRLHDPPVTVVTCDRRMVGTKAVELLVGQLEETITRSHLERYSVPMRLEVRESTRVCE